MREVVFTMIAGNPHIKQQDKPTRDQIFKLSSDEVKKEPVKKVSKKDLEKIRQRLASM